MRNNDRSRGQDLSHKVRDPIEKVRAVKEQEEERLNDLEDTAEEPSRED
jgi:hypothetical protein